VLIGSLPGALSLVGDTLANEQASYDAETLHRGPPLAFPETGAPHDDFYNDLHPTERYADTAGGVGIVATEDGDAMITAGAVGV